MHVIFTVFMLKLLLRLLYIQMQTFILLKLL